MGESFTQYAQEKGIRNGQLNRQQFIDAYTQYRAKAASGGGFSGPGGGFSGPGKKGGPPSDLASPGTAASPDVVNMQADALFQKLDRNGDGVLNDREMPGTLRDNLARWDKNGDGMIDQKEFREYYLARQVGDTDSGPRGVASIIIDEDELDRKVVVMRAGKLPSNMPKWFKELDTDNDGQVALYEWRAAGKSLEEFKKWDTNDDGLITPEEALKTQTLLAAENPREFPRGPGGAMASRDPASVQPGGMKIDWGAMMSGPKGKKGNNGGAPGGGFGPRGSDDTNSGGKKKGNFGKKGGGGGNPTTPE